MRPAVRLAALNHQPAIYVWTHDSVGLGEDGPTHQPVEHLVALRAMPNLHVLRPADANETAEAWRYAMSGRDGPTALVLSRQNLPVVTTVDGRAWRRAGRLRARRRRGGRERPADRDRLGGRARAGRARALEADGIQARVVSMPCWELFAAQDASWREAVLPPGVPRVAVEAGVTLGWERGGDGGGGGEQGGGGTRRGGLTARRGGLRGEFFFGSRAGLSFRSPRAGGRCEAPTSESKGQLWRAVDPSAIRPAIAGSAPEPTG